MSTRRLQISIAGLLVLAASLAYLRDPPWLLTMTAGLREWERDRGGVSYRWMGGHASFFVPSAGHEVDIPLRAAFDSPLDWPIVAIVTIDDRAADRLVFTNDRWQTVRLHLPAQATRRVRRIDIRVDRTRSGNRGLQVGQWEIVQARW